MIALAASSSDLYTAVAEQLFGSRQTSQDLRGLRNEVKVAFLSAMYGGGTGSTALAALRRGFPRATAVLEDAAVQGEIGGIVHSVLGRPCPPPSPGWFDEAGQGVERSSEKARSRGRFTRNFIVQASAADWANVLVACLRRELDALARHSSDDSSADSSAGSDGPRAELVFFQHDEFIVHAPDEQTDEVVAALGRAGAEATRLVLGPHAPAIPLEARVVRSYADPAPT